jgi:excisionase family DNA binding protein
VQQAATATEEYRGIVDEALQLVYSQHHRIISRLYPAAMTRISLEQLREGPLGEDLSRLAQIASGAMRAGREEVLGAIDSVLQLLFWPVGSEIYTVPRSFWEQPLGKMLSLAKLRSFEPSDLVSIGNAANILNVTRPTIYRWMDDKSLDYVRDDMSGRTFVVRQDVEAMKADIEAHEAGARGVEG